MIPLLRIVNDLFDEQLLEWEAAADSYAGLKNVRLRELTFNHHRIILQYNPGRIISSSAKVDPKSISERPCFLCTQNRPFKQRGIHFHNEYLILVNPYPVFNRHLTVPSIDHILQLIIPHFEHMLQLALELPDYTIIYNGAKCGASAPDHFHFQAVPQGIMPIETDFSEGKKTISRGHLRNCAIYTWMDYLRRPLTICGNNPETLSWLFKRLYYILQNSSGTAEEPMMNMLMHYNQGKWTVHIFLRSRHRPDQYYADEEKQLMLSPASIDMGGFMIIPREKDYELITPEIAMDVYNQVCIDEKTLDIVVENLLES